MPDALRELMLRGFRRAHPVIGPPLVRLNTIGQTGINRARPPERPATAYCVYRSVNSALVERVARDLPAGSSVHLHCLGEDVPAVLRGWTRSHGPGMRMPLIRELMEVAPPETSSPVMVFDDDVSFAGRGGRHFPGYACAGSFDIAQPAHLTRGNWSFKVTEAVALSTARETGFVEVGPVVYLSPRAWSRVLPFPPDALMGWGVDVAWSMLRHEGLRLGVVDATPILHHGAVGTSYDNEAESAQQQRHLRAAGVASAHDMAVNLGRTWRPWQRRPRWTGDGGRTP